MRFIVAPIAFVFTTLALSYAIADTRLQCQSPGPCKVLILNAEEEKVLTTQNGILDTAQQGRSLDLGALVNYFKQKIATAPAGDEQKPQGSVQGVPPTTPPVTTKEGVKK